MRSWQNGFSLIELLIVIVIIGALAAILFPLYSFARAKTLETNCCSNQYQIARAALIWAQDNRQTFPSASSFWQSLDIDKRVYKCPSYSAPHGYVFNGNLGGASIASVREIDSLAMLTADGQHQATPPGNGNQNPATFQDIAYSAADLAFRHTGDIVLSYVDGHVVSTKYSRDLPIEFRTAPAAEFDGLDTTTKGIWWMPTARLRLIKLADGTTGEITSQFLYGSQGYVLCNWDGSGDAVINLTVGQNSLGSSYVSSVTRTGLTPIMWAASSSDPRALVNPAGGQAAAGWTGNGKIAITTTDTALHSLHVYCLDWDHAKRTMTFDVLNSAIPIIAPTPGKPAIIPSVLKKTVFAYNFGEGTWLYFRFRGNITLTLQGDAGAVVSALMFD